MSNSPDQFIPMSDPFTLLCTRNAHFSTGLVKVGEIRSDFGRLYTIVWQTRIETLSCTFHKWIFFLEDKNKYVNLENYSLSFSPYK